MSTSTRCLPQRKFMTVVFIQSFILAVLLAFTTIADASVTDKSVKRGSQEYMVYAGPWSECHPINGVPSGQGTNSPAGLTFEPIVGEQTRDIKCRDAYGVLVDLSYCSGTSAAGNVSRRRVCIVPQDCGVGQWSEWSLACDEDDSHVVVRTRPVISLPQGIGKGCGPLEERNRSAFVGNVAAHWVPSPWGPCHAADDSQDLLLPFINLSEDDLSQSNDVLTKDSNGEAGRCGGGLQRRSIWCEGPHGAPLPDHYCEQIPAPITLQRCEVPCPRDCTVGEWSDWGPCEPIGGCPMTPVEELTTNGFRKRERRVITAASKEGAPCGALVEVQPCTRPACTKWVPQSWGPCTQPQGRRTGCGSGMRERQVLCQDLHGVTVPDEQCARAGAKPQGEEPCRAACPMDCVVSSWSAWSPCTHSCSSHHQKGHRHRNRTIIAFTGEDGEPCPPEEALMQTELCNTHGCKGYSWLPLPWQSCQPLIDLGESTDRIEIPENSSTEDEEEACGPRLFQSRDVWCVENNDKRVKDTLCGPIKQPETFRECPRNCPHNSPCLLSQWSEWSPCSAACGSDGGIQERQRVVIRGNNGCGALRERRACVLQNSVMTTIKNNDAHWSHGAWSPCKLAKEEQCGPGLMTRGVWCSLQHHKVPPGACLLKGPPPVSHMKCTVECATRCQLSDWSAWSHCDKRCEGVSTRSRKKLGDAPCPETVLYEGHECPCGTAHAQLPGVWSSCIMTEDTKQSSEILSNQPPPPIGAWDLRFGKNININGRFVDLKVCGVGTKYRRLACIDSMGRLLEPHWCQKHVEGLVLEKSNSLAGLVKEVCSEACPVDCRMSQWSSWGPCEIHTCGYSLQRRTRNILINATNGGRPCGFTEQTKVCSKPCSQYTWVAGGWSVCRLIPGHRELGCGTGNQYRAVRCVEVPTGGAVADALCDPQNQPPDINVCHIACPGDCVVSDWSEWSICNQPCSAQDQRDRTRALLRASRGSQSRCPPLIQAQPCLLNRTCFTYAWRMTPWGSCLPLGGSPCGEGIQQRAVYCERSDGRQVDDENCQLELRPSEPNEKFCYVDCPIDCEVSDWNPWDSSQCGCNDDVHYITRTRKIITQASATGRPCPTNLRDEVPCPLTPCYVVKRSSYSHCELDNGVACGFGVRVRNVTCVRESDGEEMPNSLCAEHIPDNGQQEDACYVDCNNECRHSPWSQWSACDLEGVRYRKRVSFKPPGPPCVENVLRYEVFEYMNCNVSETETKDENYDNKSDKDNDAEWNEESEDSPVTDQDDYYQHTDDQPEKTYLLYTGKTVPSQHTTIQTDIAAAILAASIMIVIIISILLVFKYKKPFAMDKV